MMWQETISKFCMLQVWIEYQFHARIEGIREVRKHMWKSKWYIRELNVYVPLRWKTKRENTH